MANSPHAVVARKNWTFEGTDFRKWQSIEDPRYSSTEVDLKCGEMKLGQH